MSNLTENSSITSGFNNYTKHSFLGKGGFGQCFQVYNGKGNVFAMKEIQIMSPRGNDRTKSIKSEVEIHRDLSHENIVKFHECFQHNKFFYIVLELCSNHSLDELKKRRLRITEPECRYFAKQIISGCQYLHSNGYIHRDLKLANLLLNSDMIIKIADFGLSTQVKENVLNDTVCGTMSYMAPELLHNSTYDYKVDIWAIGCILYILLVGFYPYPANKKEELIVKVNGELTIPRNFSSNTKQILTKLLQKDPNNRPNIYEILGLRFFNEYTPDSLPTSALIMTPRFDCLQFNKSLSQDLMTTVFNIDSELSSLDNDVKHNKRFYLDNLAKILMKVINESPILNKSNIEIELLLDLMKDSEDPSLAPIYWISKWVDFSDKFGMAYKLTDASTGVIFIDKTKLILTENKQNIQYIDANQTEYLYTIENCPEGLLKKRKILEYMEDYMKLNLATAGEKKIYGDKDAMVRLPYLDNAIRTETSIALYLNNGTLQFNFFQDHSKLILCPIMGALTYIQTPNIFRTFKLEDLVVNGIASELNEKLKYCLRKLACL